MLIEVAQTQNLVITESSLQEAIILVDYLRAAIKWFAARRFAASPFAKQLQRVLHGHPRQSRHQAWRDSQETGFSAKELTPILDTLGEQGDAYDQQGCWWVA